MRQRVHPRRSRNRRRQTEHKLRVQKGRQRRHHPSRDGELELRLGIGDHQELGHLAGRADGGGSTEQRHRGLLELVQPFVVTQTPRIARPNGNRLGRVHRATTADADQAVAALLLKLPEAGLDDGDTRVRLDGGIRFIRQTGGRQ